MYTYTFFNHINIIAFKKVNKIYLSKSLGNRNRVSFIPRFSLLALLQLMMQHRYPPLSLMLNTICKIL